MYLGHCCWLVVVISSGTTLLSRMRICNFSATERFLILDFQQVVPRTLSTPEHQTMLATNTITSQNIDLETAFTTKEITKR